MEGLEWNKAVVQAFVDALNTRNWIEVEALVTPDFIRHGGAEVAGREAFEAHLRDEFDIFPDAIETVEDLVAEGDRVAARHHFRGTQLGPMGPYPPSGRVLAADDLAFYHLVEGRIAEVWAVWDQLGALAMLGHAPR